MTICYIILLNNNILGVFDNKNGCDCFIKGGIQNNFFKNYFKS